MCMLVTVKLIHIRFQHVCPYTCSTCCCGLIHGCINMYAYMYSCTTACMCIICTPMHKGKFHKNISTRTSDIYVCHILWHGDAIVWRSVPHRYYPFLTSLLELLSLPGDWQQLNYGYKSFCICCRVFPEGGQIRKAYQDRLTTNII